MKLMTRIRMKAIQERCRKHHSEWQEFHHHGPCYPVAVALCRAGYGRVARGATFNQLTKRWYGHYVCLTPEGTILDGTGEYLKEKRAARVRYKGMQEVDYFSHDAYPEVCIQFWQERLKDLL